MKLIFQSLKSDVIPLLHFIHAVYIKPEINEQLHISVYN